MSGDASTLAAPAPKQVDSRPAEAGTAWYSEFDPHAAAWLRELVSRGLVPDGAVDDRDMKQVSPSELESVVQAHWFAGIGGWPRALRLAGWPDDRPIWSASLPCQPFSVAGLKQAKEDERHLWPAFRRLVARCLPTTLIGEQVSAREGREWLADVRFDLEHIVYWRALERIIGEVRQAGSLDSVSELLGEAFGRVEIVASESPLDLREAVALTDPEGAGQTLFADDWVPTEDGVWVSKLGAPARRAAAISRHSEGSLFWGDFGSGDLGGDGVQEDCRLLFGAEELADEREFTEAVGSLIAGSRRRLRVAGVRDGMEALGYEIAAADLPACCVAAPHWRSRLFWVAHADCLGGWEDPGTAPSDEEGDGRRVEDDYRAERAGPVCSAARGLADSDNPVERPAPGFADPESAGRHDPGGSGDGGGGGVGAARSGRPMRRGGGKPRGDAFRSPAGSDGSPPRSDNGVADSDGEHEPADRRDEAGQGDFGGGCDGGVAHSNGEHRRAGAGRRNGQEAGHGGSGGDSGRVADPEGVGRGDGTPAHQGAAGGEVDPSAYAGAGGYWDSAEFLLWADGKARRTVHRIRWLDDGVPPILASGGDGSERGGVEDECELDGIVWFLSTALAEPTWAADLKAQKVMPHLRDALGEADIMPEDSSQMPQAWRTASPEARETVGRFLYERGARLHFLSPLAVGEPNRKALIKGYGNAIVAQVGALFVRSFMEAVE